MFNKIKRIVKTFSFMLLNWQGQYLQKRLETKYGYDGKKVFKGCTLDLKKEDMRDSKKIDEETALILKKCKNNAEELISFFESHKTPVYKLKNYEILLKKIDEHEGLITERNGYKALYLNFITQKKIGFSTPTMIIIEGGESDIYMLIHALHKWVARKNGFSGLDEKSQTLLRRMDSGKEKNFIVKLSSKDIDKVRNAIARDVQAIDFVVKYSKEHAGVRNALEKMKNEGSANI